MKQVAATAHPALHSALSCLYEDNVPFTRPEHFYLRDEWDLDRLERFLARLSPDGGLDSELWCFATAGLEGDHPTPEAVTGHPESAAYADGMLSSCFEGEDSDTWFRREEVGLHPIY